MAVNLPPQYHDAEARYKKGKTPMEKLEALREMWVILPKHKASEKVQADLKTRISELSDTIEHEKTAPKKAAHGTFKFPKQGAGQVVLLGPGNSGKSTLLATLTNAKPEIAPYPFTTREPMPGMMEHEDVRIQLIDLPPITSDHYEHFVTDVTRGASAALLFLDLSNDDGASETLATVERLAQARRKLVPANSKNDDDDPTTYSLPTLLLATKCDDEAADIRLEIARETIGDRFPMLLVSAERGDGMTELTQAIFDILGVIRIYSKQPGKQADMTAPFTPAIGSSVAEFAGQVHGDFEEKVKTARVWGSGNFDGQTVGRDHILHDKDVVELHV